MSIGNTVALCVTKQAFEGLEFRRCVQQNLILCKEETRWLKGYCKPDTGKRK